MFLRDGTMKIVGLWGGYSPKVHDGTWLEMNKWWLDRNLAGGSVLGDCHFAWGVKGLENVVMHCPFPKPSKPSVDVSSAEVVVLSKAKQSYNEQVRKARSRLENAFGQLKSKWRAFTLKWQEEPEQLDHVMWIAVGVYNCLMG